MNETEIYLLPYFANLAFIITNVYGWILKEFYTEKPYREHFEALFPAQRWVAFLYLAQLMELPYLFMMGQPKALFYINAFSMLFFAAMMVIIGEGYFFWRRYKASQLFVYFLPMCIPVGWLLLAAWGVVPSTPDLYRWMFWVVCLVFVYYIIRVAIIQTKILRKVSAVVAGNDASDAGFPIPLSLRTRWLMLPIPLLMFGCFLCNDMYVKMARDILFTLVNIWFLLYTIKPHRKVIQTEAAETIVAEGVPENDSEGDSACDSECTPECVPECIPECVPECVPECAPECAPKYIPKSKSPKYKLSPMRCRELEQQIIDRLDSEKPFLDPTLTIESLAGQLGSNKSYISEAIKRSRFGSYYALINHYRLEHAIAMFSENPRKKIEEVSKASGFSSTSVFSQVFKRSKGMSPTQFIQEIQDISSETESE